MATQTPEIAFVFGTRPEIIKIAPIVRACEERSVDYTLFHTGQHYSEYLTDVFFDQLELPQPDENFEIGSLPQGKQTGAIMARLEHALLETEPTHVFVQGDTNSTLAGSIVTSKLDPLLGHVEAGLRSYNREMPEETNRVLSDHAADFLFAPTDNSAGTLAEEGIPDERIHVTGNTVVDAVFQHRELATSKSTVLDDLGLRNRRYCILTAHRSENVDSKRRFSSILEGASLVADELDVEVIYPIHPRAKRRIDEFDLTVPDSIRLVEPLDYFDFLLLEENTTIILTDSGGVQEEACILGTPCVTVRDETERPETVRIGANRIAGVEPEDIVKSARQMIASNSNWDNPYGDGTAADQIIDVAFTGGRGVE